MFRNFWSLKFRFSSHFEIVFSPHFQATHGLIAAHASNPQALKVIYSSLLLILKIFYSLNFQDLPEFFEDHIELWMNLSHELLSSNVQGLDSDVSTVT